MDIDSNVIHDSISFRLAQRSTERAMLSCYLTQFPVFQFLKVFQKIKIGHFGSRLTR
jgi:hypothetical protein